MEQKELIAKIIEKTGASEVEAWAALEKSGGDILDAVLILERKVKETQSNTATDVEVTAKDTTTNESEETVERLEGDVVNQDGTRAGNTSEQAARFGDSLKRLATALAKQTFTAERKGEEIISIPVLVLLILLIPAFGIIVPLLIVGLFLGCHYRVTGAKAMTFDVNEMSRKASEYAEDIKNEFAGKH